MLNVLVGLIALLFCALAISASAQLPTAPAPLDPLLQIMVTQPSIEVATNVQVTAAFDPPIARPGEKSIYRVTFNALTDSILWPDKISAPPQLQMLLSSRGQTLVSAENKLQPQTTINYHVRSTNTGSFTIPEFPVEVYGQRVTVPAAKLEVTPLAANSTAAALQLELEATNVYVGQPVKVRVLMRASSPNLIQAIQDLRFNGDGFLIDQGTARQTIAMVPINGGNSAAYQYETTLTPLVAGKFSVSAQGFTFANRLNGAMVIQGQVVIPGGAPQYLLIDSDAMTFTARLLPRSAELPGFTGAMGIFSIDAPTLSTNQTRVGDLVKLFLTVRGEGNLIRLVPPSPPLATNWQIFPAEPGGAPARQPGTPLPVPGSYATFTYKLIPLTTNAVETPAIPYSYFDPEHGAYVDLTVPPVPITVMPGSALADAALLTQTEDPSRDEEELKLSDLAESPGRTVTSLVPLQLRGWFLVLQILPLAGFFALWKWDQRRRFLGQHPEIILRRCARRELRRQRRNLHRAVASGDASGYATVAIRAMRVAVAPHYPAEPRALVGRDVLEVLGEANGGNALVQRFFAATDAAQFSGRTMEANGLIALQPELDRVLNELEAKL